MCIPSHVDTPLSGPAALLLALGLGCLLCCRESPQPPYIRLDAKSPPIANAPAARAHLVVFWASWCEPCRKEMPQLRSLAANPPAGLAVVVYSHDEGMKEVWNFFGGEPDTALNIRLDPDHAIGKSFGVEALPVAILTVQGQQVARMSGGRDWDSRPMRELLRKLIEETRN